MNILTHEMFMWTEDEKIIMPRRVQPFCGFHADSFFYGVSLEMGRAWAGQDELLRELIASSLTFSLLKILGSSSFRLCMKCIYNSWHAQGPLAVVWDVCEKLLRRPDAWAQSHHVPRSDVCDGAHSDSGRGGTLVMLLRCCMCGFMSDKVSSE